MKDLIGIQEFYNRFVENYNYLYDNYDQVAGYKEAVRCFDEELLPKYKWFVQKFAIYRQDCISSDREAAAFAFTFMDMISELEEQ